MTIEIHADLGPFNQQVRAALASTGGATVPVSSPVGATVAAGALPGVPASGLNAGATQSAVAAAMAQAQQSASPYAMQAAFGASSPNYGMLMQQAMTNAMYPVGASSPNWSYLLAQQASRGALPAAPPRSNFFGSPSLSAAKIAATFGLIEYAGATRTMASAESSSQFAKTEEESYNIRAEGIESVGSGLFGRTAAAILKYTGLGDVHGVARESRELLQARKSSDAQWTRRTTVEANAAYRDAYYGGGGTSAAEASRAEVLANRKINELTARESELSGRLKKRKPGRWVGGGFSGGDSLSFDANESAQFVEGDLELTGAARSTVHGELGTTRQERSDLQEQTRLDAKRRADAIAEDRSGVGSSIRRSDLVSRGASSRDIARFDLGADASRRASAALRGLRGEAGWADEMRRFGAESSAMEFGFGREDRDELSALRASSLSDSYRATGQNLQASLIRTKNATDIAVRREMEAGRPEVAAAIRSAGNASMGADVAARNRQIAAGLQRIETSNNVIQAQLDNNPLGGSLARIRGNRDAELNDVTDTGIGGWIQRQAITANANLQEQLAQRDFGRMRSDVNRRLGGAQERASLALHGGPLSGVRSAISSIMEQTDMDVRALEDQGLGDEAGRRRRLGLTQLRGAEAEFYRSIQYVSGSPRGIAGSGNLNGVRGAFNDARNGIGDTGRGEGGNPAGGFTPQQAAQVIEYLRQMAMQGIAALAG